MSAPPNVVLQLVARAFDVDPEDVLRRGRSEPITTARSMAMSLCAAHWRLKEEQIGLLFGGHRASVQKGKRRIRDLVDTDARIRAIWDRLNREVAGLLGEQHHVSIMVTNLTEGQAALLRSLVSMFTDDQEATRLEGFQAGREAIRWNGRRIHIQPVMS